MEYLYCALLLHKTGQKITEENVKKVLEAAGVKPDEARVKSMVAALEGVDIDKAIKGAAPIVAAPVGGAPAGAAPAKPKKEETKVSTEEAAAGLGNLFG